MSPLFEIITMLFLSSFVHDVELDTVANTVCGHSFNGETSIMSFEINAECGKRETETFENNWRCE